MAENTPRSPRPQRGKRNAPCRRLDGLCSLTDEEKAARDKAAQRYRNLAAMQRVYEAAVMQATGVDQKTRRSVYWDPVNFAKRFAMVLRGMGS